MWASGRLYATDSKCSTFETLREVLECIKTLEESANKLEKFEIIECRYGCGFAIQILATDCIFTIAFDPPNNP